MAPKISLKDSARIFSGNGPGMIILDGKEITRAEMDKIPPAVIAKIEILKGDAAAKYGEKGKQGVIILTTKQNSDKNRITETVFDDETGDSKQEINIISYGTKMGTLSGPGMIILDGKEITRAEMDKIPPSVIAKIEVLKGDAAAKYGKKGKQGVIIITTKQNGNKNRITGAVFDNETGSPMHGVNIIVYGTSTGTVSGPDGKFNLGIPEKEAKISFSFVGYIPVVTNLKSGSDSNIRLKKSITVISFDNLQNPSRPAQPEIKIDKTKPVFFVVEAMPEFPGGTTALKDYIANNTKYPSKARKKNITGTVYVNFTVDADGKVTDVYIDKKNSVDPILDKEAVKVVSNMPKWKPAEQRGKKVPVQMSVPVAFKL